MLDVSSIPPVPACEKMIFSLELIPGYKAIGRELGYSAPVAMSSPDTQYVGAWPSCGASAVKEKCSRAGSVVWKGGSPVAKTGRERTVVRKVYFDQARCW